MFPPSVNESAEHSSCLFSLFSRPVQVALSVQSLIRFWASLPGPISLGSFYLESHRFEQPGRNSQSCRVFIIKSPPWLFHLFSSSSSSHCQQQHQQQQHQCELSILILSVPFPRSQIATPVVSGTSPAHETPSPEPITPSPWQSTYHETPVPGHHDKASHHFLVWHHGEPWDTHPSAHRNTAMAFDEPRDTLFTVNKL